MCMGSMISVDDMYDCLPVQSNLMYGPIYVAGPLDKINRIDIAYYNYMLISDIYPRTSPALAWMTCVRRSP